MVRRRGLAVWVVWKLKVRRLGRALLGRFVLVDPRAVHANATLGTNAGAQIVILMANTADHARASRVPRTEREAVEEGYRAVKVGLG